MPGKPLSGPLGSPEFPGSTPLPLGLSLPGNPGCRPLKEQQPPQACRAPTSASNTGDAATGRWAQAGGCGQTGARETAPRLTPRWEARAPRGAEWTQPAHPSQVSLPWRPCSFTQWCWMSTYCVRAPGKRALARGDLSLSHRRLALLRLCPGRPVLLPGTPSPASWGWAQRQWLHRVGALRDLAGSSQLQSLLPSHVHSTCPPGRPGALRGPGVQRPALSLAFRSGHMMSPGHGHTVRVEGR